MFNKCVEMNKRPSLYFGSLRLVSVLEERVTAALLRMRHIVEILLVVQALSHASG